MPHNLSIKPSGAILTVAVSIASLAVVVANPVSADSHAIKSPASSTLGYESALTGYRSLDGEERSGWKEANDTVGEIGGWKTYANEAYQANKAEVEAKKKAEDMIEGKAMESAIATPVPDATARRIDSTETASVMDAPESADARRAVSDPLTISYQSATTDYRLYDDNPPGDWRAANDRVGEIGGWKTYAQQAYEASKLEAQSDTESGKSQ